MARPQPYNEFAVVLARNGMRPEVANGVAIAFQKGDTEVRQRLIAKFSLDHAMVALAIYSDGLYGYGDTYSGRWER